MLVFAASFALFQGRPAEAQQASRDSVSGGPACADPAGARTAQVSRIDAAAAARAGVIADGEYELFPDPFDRTEVRMELVQRRLLLYARDHGRFPGRLEEAVPADDLPWVDAFHDAWGYPFRYSASRGNFELRAAGPDGCFHTPDDVAADRAWRGWQGPASRGTDP
jgi:hypothetical protein